MRKPGWLADQVLIFVGRRLAQSVPVVWGVVTLLFVIFFLLPGDRVGQVMGGERVADPAARAAVTQKLGLDRPAFEQYGRYWNDLAHGDLGRSYVTNRDVSKTLHETAPASMRLALWALLVEVVLGVTTGVIVAIRRSRILETMSTGLSALALAVPVFVGGLLLQLTLGVFPFQHGWPDWARFPVRGIGPDTWVAGFIPVGEQWRYLLLPALTLGFVSAAVAHRLARQSVRNAMSSEWVHAARARGVAEWRVVVRHGLRSALPAVLAFLAVDLGALFGSAVVTEAIFGWPGIGGALASAIERADAPVMLGVTIVLTLVYVAINLVVDVLHRLLDPRVGSVSL